MILLDTSVWIDHLHRNEPGVVTLLERNDVAAHPMVIGELAIGSLANRTVVLGLLENLPKCACATNDEVLAFIESEKLWAKGLSLVDVHLLAAARITPGLRLWTRDTRLDRAAQRMGIAAHART